MTHDEIKKMRGDMIRLGFTLIGQPQQVYDKVLFVVQQSDGQQFYQSCGIPFHGGIFKNIISGFAPYKGRMRAVVECINGRIMQLETWGNSPDSKLTNYDESYVEEAAA